MIRNNLKALFIQFLAIITINIVPCLFYFSEYYHSYSIQNIGVSVLSLAIWVFYIIGGFKLQQQGFWIKNLLSVIFIWIFGFVLMMFDPEGKSGLYDIYVMPVLSIFTFVKGDFVYNLSQNLIVYSNYSLVPMLLIWLGLEWKGIKSIKNQK